MKKYIEAFILSALIAGFAAVGFVVSAPAFSQVVNPTYVGPAGRPITFTTHGILLGQGTNNATALTPGTSNFCLLSGGAGADPTWGSCSSGGSGTVTSASVVTANGLAGTVATANSTPAITLSTTVTGVVKGNGTALSAAVAGTDYAVGNTLFLSLCGPAINSTTISIGPCKGVDSTGAIQITLPGGFSKSFTAAWASGTANGGMGNGLTIAANTWYYVYAILVSGANDAYIDTSPTAANAPAGTTANRYIGSFKTDGSAHGIAQTQSGNIIYWNTPTHDLVAGVSTTMTPVTLNVPPAKNNIRPIIAVTSALTGKYFLSPQSACVTPSFENGGGIGSYTMIDTYPTASGSPVICYQADSASSPVDIWTVGYINGNLPTNATN